MTMTRSVLCPVDFSAASLAAVAVAREEAQRRGAKLDLLHVWLPGRDMTGEVPPIPLSQAAPVATLSEELRSLAADLPDERLGLHICDGDPVQMIVETATRLESVLLVVGSHARQGRANWMIGSVCGPLLECAPCPVLVCRGPEKADDSQPA